MHPQDRDSFLVASAVCREKSRAGVLAATKAAAQIGWDWSQMGCFT